ncbi:hypothetical protein [Streptomyces sp. ODS28]|uniref:hypothetical protein n=1 Tax=Streptomyces sp. ODS28 TaxID=3136688 RepID=UPI0031F12223
MSGDDRPTMPPVRLPSEAELARDALAAPLFTRAAKLARWSGEGAGVPVGAGGELLAPQLKEAVERLGLGEDENGPVYAAEAWNLAVETGLLEVEEHEEEAGGDGDSGPENDEPVGAATPGEELERLTGSPSDVLGVWQDGLETVLMDAATPSFEDLLGDLEGAVGEDGQIDPDSIDLDALDWNPEQESEFLDGALGNLYLLSVTDGAVGNEESVPLPMLAASMVVPDEMEQPDAEVLEQVSSVLMRLDDMFRVLEPTGLIEYHPVDEALMVDVDDAEAAGLPELPEGEEEDITRYGMVRLTTLGLYGVRERMLSAGVDAPRVGDLAGAGADKLLAALPSYSEPNAQTEVEGWLAGRDTVDAARQLLAAARGADDSAPMRRLACQQALAVAGPEAEPALREVLDDRELGGLARVWLAERGAQDVPQPDEDMVFWLTIDTIAAHLGQAGDEPEDAEHDELRGLVESLVGQHTGFFDKAWRADHPATGDVLEAMGRVHPDKGAAKEARKAAFKARSR